MEKIPNKTQDDIENLIKQLVRLNSLNYEQGFKIAYLSTIGLISELQHYIDQMNENNDIFCHRCM